MYKKTVTIQTRHIYLMTEQLKNENIQGSVYMSMLLNLKLTRSVRKIAELL
jgi:virulence-associated protein VapD